MERILSNTLQQQQNVQRTTRKSSQTSGEICFVIYVKKHKKKKFNHPTFYLKSKILNITVYIFSNKRRNAFCKTNKWF